MSKSSCVCSSSAGGRHRTHEKGSHTMNLSEISTADLVRELIRREGVDAVTVAPYAPYAVTTGGQTTQDTGPAALLFVTD